MSYLLLSNKVALKCSNLSGTPAQLYWVVLAQSLRRVLPGSRLGLQSCQGSTGVRELVSRSHMWLLLALSSSLLWVGLQGLVLWTSVWLLRQGTLLFPRASGGVGGMGCLCV